MPLQPHPAALCLLALAAAAPAFAQTPSATQNKVPPEAAPLVHRTPAKAATGAKSSTAPPATAQAPSSIPKPVPIHLGLPPEPGAAPAKPKAAPAATGSTGTKTTTPAKAAATGSTTPPAKPVTATPSKPAATTQATTPAKPAAAPPTAKPVAPSLPTQPAVSQTFNHNVIFLDPAHGGVDGGSRIGDSTQEKDVTLSLAFKLRSLLAARGFTVVMSRDADTAAEPNAAGTPITLDDRAGIANHHHAVACLLLHATGSGTGVHLYTSELDATAGDVATPLWLTAQAPWVAQSRKLSKSLATAFTRSHLPLVAADASIRPVDSMTCPAVVIELAPDDDSDASSINDASYQQHVAEAISSTLVFWKNQAEAPVRLTPATTPAQTGAQP